MSKDIKTKEVVRNIKTIDRKKGLEHFEKQNDISSKDTVSKTDNSANNKENPKKLCS